MSEMTANDWMSIIGRALRDAGGIDFGSLARYAGYRQRGGQEPAVDSPSMMASSAGGSGIGREGGGSYAPLADALHDTPISMMGERPPLPPQKAQFEPKPQSAADREKARVNRIVERAIEGSVARGTLERDAADALLEGRYSAWLEKKHREKAATTPATPPIGKTP
ncbi:MAG: hypothetical protein KI792_07580 [Alphaproteobacteria bacterium]|nr:hypothetical protein [Alphaproteobacteria bacterium SS10]